MSKRGTTVWRCGGLLDARKHLSARNPEKREMSHFRQYASTSGSQHCLLKQASDVAMAIEEYFRYSRFYKV